MEYWVNAPLRGKFKVIVDRGHHLYDLKRSVSFGRKFGGWLCNLQVAPFKPYLIPDPEFGRIPVFLPGLLCSDHQFLCSFSGFLELLDPECHLWNGGRAVYPVSAWVVSHEEHERGLPCSFVCPIIVYEFRNGNIRGPVLLVVVDIKAEILFDPLVGGF